MRAAVEAPKSLPVSSILFRYTQNKYTACHCDGPKSLASLLPLLLRSTDTIEGSIEGHALLLGQGDTLVAIARELNLSLSRVRKIAAQIKRKWNAGSMLEVAINARILDAFPGA
jgi:hypothetical protein